MAGFSLEYMLPNDPARYSTWLPGQTMEEALQWFASRYPSEAQQILIGSLTPQADKHSVH